MRDVLGGHAAWPMTNVRNGIVIPIAPSPTRGGSNSLLNVSCFKDGAVSAAEFAGLRFGEADVCLLNGRRMEAKLAPTPVSAVPLTTPRRVLDSRLTPGLRR